MSNGLSTPGSGTTLWDVLDRIEDYLQAREDVRDGSDGVQLPNEAMSLRTELIYARVDYARKSVSSESEPTFEWIIERLDGHYWDSLSQHKALILQHVAGALQTPKAPPLFTGEDGRYEGIRTPDKNDEGWGMGPDGEKDVLAYINKTPMLLSLLYDLNMLPEQHWEKPRDGKEWCDIFTITNHFREHELALPSAIGALAWVELPYDETEWSSEPREGEVHWLTDEVLVIVKDKKLWRIELPKIPSASTDGGGA